MNLREKAPPFTLYEHRPSPFCVAVRIGLKECAAPFTARPAEITGPRSQAFLHRSPFGTVPALVEHKSDGEQAIFGSAAILLFLAARFPHSPLSFADSTSRGSALSWLFCVSGDFAPRLFHVLSERSALAESERSPRFCERENDELMLQLQTLDQHLAHRAFLAGDYSVADTLSTPLLDLLPRLDIDLGGFPRLRGWHARLRARPSYHGAWPGDDDDA